jgi:quinohemoprotein ethanol dehydrogenase
VYVYKLGGTASAPEFAAPAPMPPLDLAQIEAPTGDPAKGAALFGEWCAACHIGGIYTPDLTRSPRIYTYRSFAEVVHGGALRPRGMASFRQWLKQEDVESLRAYFIAEAKKAPAAP